MEYSNEVINDNILMLRLSGDLIGENNGAAILELTSEYINKKMRHCIVDISGIRYINSSGIGVLITILTKFRNQGGDVYLVQPSDNVKKLLVITKLNTIFNITESKDEAIAGLSNI